MYSIFSAVEIEKSSEAAHKWMLLPTETQTNKSTNSSYSRYMIMHSDMESSDCVELG